MVTDLTLQDKVMQTNFGILPSTNIFILGVDFVQNAGPLINSASGHYCLNETQIYCLHWKILMRPVI